MITFEQYYTQQQTIEEINWRKAKALGALGLASTGLFGGPKAHATPDVQQPSDAMVQTVGDRMNKLNYTKDRKSGRINFKPSGGNHVFTGSDMGMSEQEYKDMVNQYKAIAKQVESMKIYKDVLDSFSTEQMEQFITTAEQQGMFEPSGQFEGMSADQVRKDAKVMFKSLKWVLDQSASSATQLGDFFAGLNRAGYIDWSK